MSTSASIKLQELNKRVSLLIQDDAGRLKSGEIDGFLLEALAYYSKDAPYIRVNDIAADDGYQYDLPPDWAEGFSCLLSVEYPAGAQVPLLLEPGDYTLYKSPSALKLHFYNLAPESGKTVRLTYTTLYDASNLDAIPLHHRDAFCLLAASLCCGALARYYAQTADGTIEADSVDYKSKGDEYARRARELLLRYNGLLGKKEGMPSAAGGSCDWDATYSWGGDFLLHPRRGR